MKMTKVVSVAAAAAMALSMTAVVSYADTTVTLDSTYTGDWSRSAGIEKSAFDGFTGDVKVVLTVEAVNVKDGNSYIIKPMDIDKGWDAITSSLTTEKGVCKPDGFMQIKADQTEVEFVVPAAVVADLWNGGIAFQVNNVIVKSATLSDGTAENAFTIVEDKDTPDYCAGKFDPFAVVEEAPAEETTEETEATVDATVEDTVEETAVEETVEDVVEEDVAEDVEEDVEEDAADDEEEEEEVADEASGLDLEALAEANGTLVASDCESNGAWGQAAVLYTYNNIAEDEEPGENPFDVSMLNADTAMVVFYEAETAPELILQSWSGGEGWAKVPANETYSKPGMAVFTYDYMTAMYQSEDFSTVDAVNIGDTGTPLTVSAAYVVDLSNVAAEAADDTVEATVEATVSDDTTTVAADTQTTDNVKTGNTSAAAIAAIMAVAGAAVVAARKRK